MKKEDILFLNQLINSLMESTRLLEKDYKKRKADEFNKTKKSMINLQKEIAKILT